MTREEKKIINCYIALRAAPAFGIAFIAATYATFLISKGLNLFQVNLVNFFFYGTLLVFEIPTGAFADVFGRKLSFVISCFLFSIGMFVYAISTSFWMFVIAETIAAIGSTFANGAIQAWLVDRLKQEGYRGTLSGIFSKEQQIRGATGIVAALIGAFTFDISTSLPWIFGGCVMCFAGILAIASMDGDKIVRHKFSWSSGLASMTSIVKTSIRYGLNNKAVKFVIVLGFAQYFAVQAPNMEWQPFFDNFLSHKSGLGFIFAGISIAMIIGSALAPRVLRKIENEKVALSVTQMIIGAGICGTVLCGKFIPALTIFLVHEIARGLFVPLKDTYLNDNIPSEERATLISFESISHHIGGMTGLLISGLIAQYFSLQSAWILSGAVLITSTLLLLKNGGNASKTAQ